MGGSQPKTDSDTPPGNDGQEAPGPRAGAPISAVPDDAQKQWNWTADSSKHRVWIVHIMTASFPLSDAAASASGSTHFGKKPIEGPSCDKIRDTMAEAGRGDIFTYALHTVFSKVDGNIRAIGVGGSETKPEKDFKDMKLVFLAEMLAAFNDGSSPAAVVLCGCGSAEFLPYVIQQTNVPVALGIGTGGYDDIVAEIGMTANIVSVDCSAAADAATASLIKGETINQAVAAGAAAIKSKTYRWPMTMVAEVKDFVKRDKSLKDNKLLPKFR